MRDPHVITKSPDRPNITLFIEKVSPGVQCLDWLVDMLDRDGEKCSKVIVYCRSFDDCADVYAYFESCFGANTVCLHKRLFDMVHSRTPDDVKRHVQESIQQEDSRLRILIATKVIGMGLDLAVDMIVHYGPPSTVEDYLQQIGRSGRRGGHANAVLLYSGKQLRNVESEMLRVIKSDKCHREEVLQGFHPSENQAPSPKHLCCNTCKTTCDCGHCVEDCNMYETTKATEEQHSVPQSQMRRVLTEEDKTVLKLALFELKEDLDRDIYLSMPVYGKPDIIHGLDLSTVKMLVSCSEYIFSVDYIIDKVGLSIYSTVCRVVQLFSDLFKDMDIDIEVNEDLAIDNTE